MKPKPKACNLSMRKSYRRQLNAIKSKYHPLLKPHGQIEKVIGVIGELVKVKELFDLQPDFSVLKSF